MWLCFRPHILRSTRLCADTKFMDTNVQRNIPLLKQMGAKSSREHNSTSFFFCPAGDYPGFSHDSLGCVEILTGPSAAPLTATLCIDLN